MSSADRPAPRRAVIAGIARIDQPQLPNLTEYQVHARAAQAALDDAGLTFADVDGYGTAGFFPMHAVQLAEFLGLHPDWIDEVGFGGASFEVLLEHATYAIEAGACDVALITYGSTQLSDMGRRIGAKGQRPALQGPGAVDGIWGNTLPGAYALAAQRHMHEHGTTSEQLAEIAVAIRHHASHNPNAMYRDEITVDDVLTSRMIADPLHMFDCCVVSDGGAAIVVTTAERAADLAQTPIHVLGAAHATTHHVNISQMPDLTVSPAAQSGPLAFERARLTPDDVDVAQLYDSFTITVLLTLEDLGFCAKGEGGAFVEGGTLRYDGDLPTNTDGGGLSALHPGMRGLFLLVEAARQLRGEAGATQVDGAEVAVCHGTGGMLSTGATVLLGKEPT